MEKLKPCPFCGSIELNGIYCEYNLVYPVFWIECLQCGAQSINKETLDEAVSWWNRRAGEKDK